MSSRLWSVYLISTGERTYIGSTTDVKRRLRQHNGEIRGGARSTSSRKGKWKLILYVTGFENRSAACSWERIVKCRRWGVRGRSAALRGLVEGLCPKGRKEYEVPQNLQLVEG